ncbi:MAG TPA: ABC transporter family substrate-binding protein [Pseudolysinimonas sp.]
MKLTRVSLVGAIIAAGALVLSGCAAGGGSEIQQGTILTAVENSAFTGANGNTADGNTTYNNNINYMTSSGFNYYDNTPKLVKNTKFGTYTVESKSPLTIKYTVADGVKWSDGTPVDAADMMLDWAANISKYNDPKGDVNFTSAAAGGGLDLVTDVPKISDNNKSVTIVYSKDFVDWETAFGVGMPAHIVYEEAFPKVKDAQKAKDALVKAIQTDDKATMVKLAKVWGHGFDMTSTPSDKKLLVSDGPYQITKLVKDQYVTLKANKDYNWGPLPKLSQITVRFIQDPTAQVQALQNGEVSVISGQADADTVAALKASTGISQTTTSTATYEHIDLTFNNGGPFDPATYGGDATKALEVRQAFLKTIPRQDIVDKLIKPIQDSAKLDDSQTFLPGSAGYAESVADNGSADYATVDIAGAKALLAQAGVPNPSVKFMYGKSNTRRASEFALIQASAAQAGFNVIDAGDDTWGQKLGDGTYDAVLFAWQFTSLAVTGTQTQIQTDGGNNFNGYSNKDADDAFNKLTGEYDASKQQALLAQVDKDLWADAYGVTIFQFPEVTAWSNKVKNVSDNPLSPSVFWNFFDWTSSVKTSTK